MGYSESKEEEEDYINMEVDDAHSNNEFEFQSSVSKFSLPAVADHLFHMGKLLPLRNDDESSTFTTPVFTPTATSAHDTPFESCNISPSDSQHVSMELNPIDYRIMTSSYGAALDGDCKKHPNWTKKIKWATYLKSLFTKASPKKQGTANGHFKTSSNAAMDHRRSFSRGLFFKPLSKPKTPSASSSSSSSEIFKTELENPIQAAIAHCKRSHQQLYSKQIAAM